MKSCSKKKFRVDALMASHTHTDTPLFQLYSFFTSTCPLGLKGPFSEKAPTPSEEHPGPTQALIQRNLKKSKDGQVHDKILGSRIP